MSEVVLFAFSCLTSFKVLYCQLKRLVGRHEMLAECIVAVGTMLVPLAIVLLTTIKGFPLSLAQNLIFLGAVALIVGLVIAVKNEVRASRREKRLDMRDRLRRRLDKADYIVLVHIAKKLGANMDEFSSTPKKGLNKDLEQELEELENEL